MSFCSDAHLCVPARLSHLRGKTLFVLFCVPRAPVDPGRVQCHLNTIALGLIQRGVEVTLMDRNAKTWTHIYLDGWDTDALESMSPFYLRKVIPFAIHPESIRQVGTGRESRLTVCRSKTLASPTLGALLVTGSASLVPLFLAHALAMLTWPVLPSQQTIADIIRTCLGPKSMMKVGFSLIKSLPRQMFLFHCLAH